MIPVKQTILDFEHGNCVQACVASILEMKLDEVPNFMAAGPDAFETNLDLWCGYNGLKAIRITVEPQEIIEGCYVIASGLSPRATEGQHHAVVWYNGEIVHDPHPSDLGIVGDPDDFTVFMVRDLSTLKRSNDCFYHGGRGCNNLRLGVKLHGTS